MKNLYTRYITPFDNEQPTTTAPAAPAAPEAVVTLTEEQLAGKIAEAVAKHQDAERQKYETENTQLLSNIDMLQKKANITEEERKRLQKSKEELENRMLTQEQLDRKAAEKAANEHKTQLGKLEQERDSLKQTLNNQTIDRSILDAVNAPDVNAYNPNLVHTVLRPYTQLEEQVDEAGNPTGIVPVVKLPSVNDAGQAITLSLTATQAVEHLKEQREYANLFIGKGVSGLGLHNDISTQSSGDVAKDAALAGDMRQYFKARGITLK